MLLPRTYADACAANVASVAAGAAVMRKMLCEMGGWAQGTGGYMWAVTLLDEATRLEDEHAGPGNAGGAALAVECPSPLPLQAAYRAAYRGIKPDLDWLSDLSGGDLDPINKHTAEVISR